MKRKINLTIYIVLILFATGCSLKKEVSFSGKTMGTTYHVRVVGYYFRNLASLEKKIKTRLAEINQVMSVYIDDSEVSRFNALQETGKNFPVSDDFVNIIKTSRQIYQLTSGAWDATVTPLVNIWGFGFSNTIKHIPEKNEIDRMLRDVGFNQIQLVENRYLVKHNPAIMLDFGSIAKGYAVDQLIKLMHENGIRDCLVEIGGEVFAAGFRKDGEKWKIGINTPDSKASFDQVYRVLSLTDKGLATSGDYRNFFDFNRKRFSHIIDPRTGFPVSNGIVSVSIIADTCVFADGLATAVMVMGVEKGLELIKKIDSVEGLIITRNQSNKFTDIFSKGFQSLPFITH